MDSFINKVKELQEKFGPIYIYGAGYYGQRVYNIFQENRIKVQGFVVTNDVDSSKKIRGGVLRIDEVELENAVLVVSASRYNSIEMLKTLKERHCDNSRIICACEYLDNRKINESYYTMPTIDVTTVIGCKVNCKYCPQDLLLKNYFKEHPHRDSAMTMETFIACLNHLPERCNIMFCGMAEPFLNPLCVDMICKAYESGKNIELYSTLVGITQDGLEKIWDIPIDFVNIHVADVSGYANIPTTESFFELVKKAIEHKKKDGTPFVNLCNAQGEPHPWIRELCNGKLDISTVLHDRAGNLEDEKLFHKKTCFGKLTCSRCGQKLNNNVLLPDGTLLLCCMDYGMKHVLGNLKYTSYEEILNGEILKNIKRGLMGNDEIDILCRNCSFASKLN